MEYIYAAMLLHKAGKKVEEGSIRKVLEAAGVAVDDARVRALVAALQGVDIEKAIKEASVAPVAVAAPAEAKPGKKEDAKKEEKEEKEVEEKAAAGLGALFG